MSDTMSRRMAYRNAVRAGYYALEAEEKKEKQEWLELKGGVLTVFEGTKIIDALAFERNRDVKKVTLPASLRYIEQRAFKQCRNLTDINLPDGLLQIDRGAFAYCDNLQSITIPSSVMKIGDCAFVGSKIKEFVFPDYIEYLGFNVFRSCHCLERVVMPHTTKEITRDKRLFENCENLKQLEVSASCIVEDGCVPDTCNVVRRN